jgi:hypothetical protein
VEEATTVRCQAVKEAAVFNWMPMAEPDPVTVGVIVQLYSLRVVLRGSPNVTLPVFPSRVRWHA